MDYPHIILVSIDALRADHLGWYGYKRNTSPFLDRVFSRAVAYRFAFSAAPYTKPSFKTIFTGLYPFEKGSYDSIFRYDTLASILLDMGYFTVGIPNNPVLSKKFGFAKGFKLYLETKPRESLASRLLQKKIIGTVLEKIVFKFIKYLPIKTQNLLYYPAEEINALVNNILLQIKRKLSNGKPLFLWIHYMDVHQPYFPPDPKYYQKLNKRRFNEKEAELLNKLLLKFVHGHIFNVSEDISNGLKMLYDSEILYLDSQLYELWSILDKFNILENAIIIFLADHGDEFYEHGGLGHAGRKFVSHMYNELLRVPLAIYSETLTSSVINQKVSLVDLVPTLINIIKHKAVPQTTNILPITNSSEYKRTFIISETSLINKNHHIRKIPFNERRVISVIVKNWKYIYYEFDKPREELYDLEHDFSEKKNLVSEKQDLASILRDYVKNRINSTRREHLAMIVKNKI